MNLYSVYFVSKGTGPRTVVIEAQNFGDKVRAVRDFSVEPFFDQGWEVKKGMVGFVYAIDLGDGELRWSSMRRSAAVEKKGISY